MKRSVSPVNYAKMFALILIKMIFNATEIKGFAGYNKIETRYSQPPEDCFESAKLY